MTAHARPTLVATIALTMLVACGGSPAPDEDAADDAEAAAELGRDTDATVLDDMIGTQDRARAVEDVTLGRKDDLDHALEASAGDTATEDAE